MPSPRPARRRAAHSLLILGVLAAACGGGDRGAAGCGRIVREPLDPSYLVHVLGSADDVDYQSDPPTSGPHQPGPALEGVVDEPLSRPIQVGVLEGGGVLVQHRPDLSPTDRELLASVAGSRVVVAPNPGLADPVVATAWTYKLTCADVDVEALEEFISARSGKGPEG